MPGDGRPADGRLIFFDVSIPKLVVLSVCSLGIYELYWFYKNWQIVRARERSDISPLSRAVFGYFFCYALFKRIRDYDAQTGGTRALPAGALAAGWMVVTFLWQLPGRYSLVANLSCLFMVPVQVAANRINELIPLKNGDDISEVDGFFWGIWEAFIEVAGQTPHDHPSQQRLVQVIEELARLPIAPTTQGVMSNVLCCEGRIY